MRTSSWQSATVLFNSQFGKNQSSCLEESLSVLSLHGQSPQHQLRSLEVFVTPQNTVCERKKGFLKAFKWNGSHLPTIFRPEYPNQVCTFSVLRHRQQKLTVERSQGKCQYHHDPTSAKPSTAWINSSRPRTDWMHLLGPAISMEKWSRDSKKPSRTGRVL